MPRRAQAIPHAKTASAASPKSFLEIFTATHGWPPADTHELEAFHRPRGAKSIPARELQLSAPTTAAQSLAADDADGPFMVVLGDPVGPGRSRQAPLTGTRAGYRARSAIVAPRRGVGLAPPTFSPEKLVQPADRFPSPGTVFPDSYWCK